MVDDFDYDLDPADLIVNEQRRSAARTISALGDSPDDAARAEQIARVSQENPSVVYGNLEEREKQLKTALTTQLMNNNQFLRQYVDAHPLANKVSNDDYGQLDAVTESMFKIPMWVRKPAYNIATGIEGMMGLTVEGLGYMLGVEGTKGSAERFKAKTLKDVSAGPAEAKEFKESESSIPGVVFQGAGTMVGLLPSIAAGGLVPAAVQMGLMGGAEAKNRAAAAGVDEQTQATAFTTGFAINAILGAAPLHYLIRPAQAQAPGALSWSVAKLKDSMISGGLFTGFGEVQHAFNEYAARLLFDPKATYHPDFNRIVGTFILGGMMGMQFNKVKPYVDAGQEIPPGAHPIIAQAKAKQAEVDIDNLDNALKEASKSATRERSPELFKIFMRQHTDAKIGVSADAIVKLYGDVLPAIDDNKLGWVPNIKEQLAVARETGGDVEIPLADWLAHVDPALAKELHDDVRVRPKGLTIREGTALEAVPMVEAWHASPHVFDAFSMQHIGKGEGAQSYGHGLYFAESEKVSGPQGEYAKRFSKMTIEGREPDLTNPRELASVMIAEGGSRLRAQQMILSDIAYFEQNVRQDHLLERSETDAAKLAAAKQAMEILKYPDDTLPKAVEKMGNAYRVRLHAEKDQFLDWDLPLSKQSAHVQERLAQFGIKGDLTDLGEFAGQKIEGAPRTGSEAYEQMRKVAGQRMVNKNLPEQLKEGAAYAKSIGKDAKAEASKLLAEAGIPGIRYLDQGSRQQGRRLELERELADFRRMEAAERAGGDEALAKSRAEMAADVEAELAKIPEPTYNYVIFDERLIEIVDRNGEAIQAVREQAGLEPLARRKELWTDEKLEQAADTLEGQVVERGPGIKTVEPTGELTVPEIEAVLKANEILERILPNVDKVPARLITQDGKGGIQGMFQQYTDRIPTIMYLMDPKKAAHTVRHEAIHFLRREGFFTKEEWDILRQVAIKDGWIEHYDIAQRYPKENLARMLEEAVSERYADWADGNKYGTERVESIFGRIKDLAFNVIKVIKEALPHDMTIEEIFQNIESGEIAKRTGTKPLDKEAFRAAQEMDPAAEAAQRSLFAKANAIGMTVPQFERHMKNIAKLREEDYKAQMERAEALERKKQTAEWKKDEARIREEVTNDIQFRPDIAVATFFTEGRLYDTIKNQRPKLDASLVPEDLAKRLPKELLVKRGGIDPDDIAPLFGYQTGREMVSKLAEMSEARGDMKFGDFVKMIVDDEVLYKMMKEHGVLEENILKAAQDHVIDSNTQMDILHEEFVGLGMKSKMMESPFTKEQIQIAIKDRFDRLPISTIKTDKFLSEAGKAGREAEMKMLIGKWGEAFEQKQKQYLAMLFAREAKRFEREQEQFEKTAKRFAARKIETVEQSYVDYVQALLSLTGQKVRRSDKEIAESIEAFGTGSLEEFVARKIAEGGEFAVSENVQQSKVKPLEEMNVAEFREFKEAIDSLIHVGREEKKIIVGEQKQEFEAVKQGIIGQITTLPIRDLGTKIRYMFDATLVKMEEIARDLDGRMEGGPLFKSLIVPLSRAKRREYDMLKKLSEDLDIIRDLGNDWKKSLNEAVPNDFLIDPRTQTPYNLTRQNMINIMLNFGNRSNIQKFTEGYAGKKNAGTLEARLWQLFDQHATKQDWEFVQRIWDLFEGWRGESDAMYRRIAGVPPKWIELQKVQTRHGEFDGGYFPILFDRDRSRIEVIEDKAAATSGTYATNYVRATTGASYTKARTGFTDFVTFEGSIEQVFGRMQQIIHDITHREAVNSVGKIIYDPEIRAAIRKHYGPEYSSQFHPWLKDVANHYNSNEAAIQAWNNLGGKIRSNLIIHALGFNLRVILSPNVGMFNLKQTGKFYLDYFANRDLVMEKSNELPHTMRNMDRDFREKLEVLTKKSSWSQIQKNAFEVSMWTALQFEQQARMIGFYTKYHRGIRKGLSDAEAIAEADNAVRSFHGSAGVMDLPALMRHPNEFVKTATVFYGFFNTMYNWQRRIPGDVRQGEFKEALKNTYGAVLIPAAFGAVLFNQGKESDPWWKTIVKALVIQPLSTIPVVREASNFLLEGYPARTPSESVVNAVSSIISDVKKYKEGKRITKPISHAANVIGLTAGLPLAQAGRTGQFTSDVIRGVQRPRNIQEWMRGVISGEARLKP